LDAEREASEIEEEEKGEVAGEKNEGNNHEGDDDIGG